MIEIDWATQADRLRDSAAAEASWNDSVAATLVRSTDRTAVDVGCGGGGMAKALAATLPPDSTVVAIDADAEVLAEARRHTGDAVRCVLASLDDGAEPLHAAIGRPADLIWASASVHHAADQQRSVDALASLLAPGGRLALAEGGLPTRHLPWDLGIGEPGLELRLDLAQDRWFAAMRESLPGSVPMPYGWTEALSRAGLEGVTTRTVLTERPAPLSASDRALVVEQLRHRVDRLRPADPATPVRNHGENPRHGHDEGQGHGHDQGHGHGHGQGHGHGHGHGSATPAELALPPADLAIWDQLLDSAGDQYLGNRNDLTALSARSIHVGHAPG